MKLNKLKDSNTVLQAQYTEPALPRAVKLTAKL